MADSLRSLGLASEAEVASAEEESARTGVDVDEVLVHAGTISEDEQLAVRSTHYKMPRADVSGFEPAPEALALVPQSVATQLRCVPLAVDERDLYVACAQPMGAADLELLHAQSGRPVRVILATLSSLDRLLQSTYGVEYMDSARLALLQSDPESSASKVLSQGQKATFIGLTLITLGSLVLWTILTLIVLIAICSALYLAFSLYKFWLAYHSLEFEHFVEVTDEDIATLDETTLPIYTILVPLYKEAAVIGRLTDHIEALDYPKAKLDVMLLCEEDDRKASEDDEDGTIDKILAMNLPPHYRLIIAPDFPPKTKPKACNYGLLQARGEYVVIFDAEDRPEADQLKKAILAFRKSPADVACVQARLNYFNQTQNILTRWFSIEYSMHFDLLLPGLCSERVPVPLGGTSNHFVRERLLDIGAWDPYNVTEDADLGIRLHKDGYYTAMIDSTTLEEANSDLHNWIRQRSRWNKGYVQTWLVHMRHPLRLFEQLGPKGFLSFNLVFGGTFTLLLNPIFWTLTTVFLLTQAHLIQMLFPSFLFYAAASLLFIGNFTFVYFNVAGTMQHGHFSLTRHALLSPIYWGLMSWGAWKGFIQLFTKPFYWEKTIHGLDGGGGGA
jgi:cellulose synthase/poly-beta-1,6-N-acetylglucosamine synthase-like glycosyltransferase